MPQQEICDQLIKLFATAPIKKTTGMTLSYNDKGQGIFDFKRNPNFDHALNDVHDGLIATLLDNAGWFTVAAHYGCWVVTVEFSVKLLEEARQENLQSIGTLIRAGKRLATAEMKVVSESGRLVAIGSGTFATTSKSIESSN
ncbi:PaaI family thioesterase [bacterium]|nr:PaaI family thioesterase [bacterium]